MIYQVQFLRELKIRGILETVMEKAKPNIYAIDAMRVKSILAVVLIHTTSRVLEHFNYNINSYPITLFLDQLARFAVPLFFLISGFVLEFNWDEDVSYWQYLKKRFNRILIPYVFWSALYFFFIFKDSENFFRALTDGSASYQLYFIPALLILYLLFPLFHKIYKYISAPPVLVFLGGVETAILYREYFIKNFSIPFPIAIALFSFYVFLLGMVASRNYEKLLAIFDRIKYFLFSGVVLSMVYLYLEARSRYFLTYNIDAFYSSWRPSTLVYTILVGSFLFWFFSKVSYGSNFIKLLSKLSFFIFFIHTLILEYVWKVMGVSWKVWYDVPFFLAVSATSFVIAFIAHKIPYLSKLTG